MECPFNISKYSGKISVIFSRKTVTESLGFLRRQVLLYPYMLYIKITTQEVKVFNDIFWYVLSFIAVFFCFY